MTTKNRGFAPGSIYEYTPDNGERHCREGVAYADSDGSLIDTFWGVPNSDPFIRHYLTDTEIATAQLVFNVNDLREARPHETLNWYPKGTVFAVTSQHGLRRQTYVVPGTQPDAEVIIDEAHAAYLAAKDEAAAAQRRVEWAHDEWMRMLDGRAAELAASFAQD